MSLWQVVSNEGTFPGSEDPLPMSAWVRDYVPNIMSFVKTITGHMACSAVSQLAERGLA